MSTLEKPACLLSKIPFEQTNSFSRFFLDYIQGAESLKGFHNGLPTAENLLAQIENRDFPDAHRSVLHQVLIEQYSKTEKSERLEANLESLKSGTTYTITTGHQLNIFTGPLYFIYKIVTVIRACEELKTLRPDCDFVPVYWMASEDHDFEEISYFRYGGKKFEWQTNQTGAVGRFETKSIKHIFDDFLGLPDFFRTAYLKHKTLAEAVRYYVNHLFGDYGLVVVDADDSRLKKLFQPVIESDIFEHTPQQKATAVTEKLEQLGYGTQVHPREINFFYLKDNVRSRIVEEGENFAVLDTDILFTKEEMKVEIARHPERFSPNVVLRPLYQEFLLPNLAYVGGPSELVYWLQLKGIFDSFETAFPLLMPRNFAGVINAPIQRKIEQLGLSFEELFKNDQDLVNEKVVEQSTYSLDLDEEKRRIQQIFKDAHQQAEKIDTTLERLIWAEYRKAEKSLEKIEKKLLKAERRNQEVLVNRIYAVKEALFPGGAPQERKDNFLNFYLNDPNFIARCMEAFDPFDYRFHLISANE